MNKRYNHILVPLDGSELAESALVDAFSLAQLSQAQVTLLQVIAPIDHVLAAGTDYPIFVDQQWEGQRMIALSYMNGLCKRLGCP
ncbi:MAG: universal stress protein, partial [Nitrospira sp.]|nr:universal stress protein [Nitrospira sp.]